MKINKKYNFPQSIATLFILSFILSSCGNSSTESKDKKDMILILDTSYSMVGKAPGAKEILPQVKTSLPVFIDQLQKDDSITFITFDEEVKVFPTIYIYDKKNKDSLIDYIKNVNATGQWTYTRQMIEVALGKAQELELKDKERQQIIVAMTDALDDPPPQKRKDQLNIREIAQNYKDKEWFIFFIDFSSKKDNVQLSQIQKDLKTVSEYTEIIKTEEIQTGDKSVAGKGSEAKLTDEQVIAKSIESDLTANIEKMSVKKSKAGAGFPFLTVLIVLAIAVVVLVIIYIFKRFSGVKVTGKLEYWDHTMLSPYFEKYDLTKQEKREILIGRKTAHNLRIRDIEIADPAIINALRVGKEIKNNLQAGKGYEIEYINRDASGYLKNGDIFRIVNYTFKYMTD